MKYSQLINAGFKIIGIYWLVDGLIGIVEHLLLFFVGPESVMPPGWKADVVRWVLINVLYATAGYMLVLHTQAIVTRLKIGDDHSGHEKSTTATNFEALAFSLLGFYFAVPAISTIIPMLLWASQNTYSYELGQDPQFAQTWVSLTQKSIVLIIGLALIIGRNRLAQIWKRLRPLSETDN
jgi:hypothetical protein